MAYREKTIGLEGETVGYTGLINLDLYEGGVMDT